jgi:hypothetical protein
LKRRAYHPSVRSRRDTHERIRRNEPLPVREFLVPIPRRPCSSSSASGRSSLSRRLDPVPNLLLLLRPILVPTPFGHLGRVDIDDQRTPRTGITGRRCGCIGGGWCRSDEFLHPLADLIEVLFVPLITPHSTLPHPIALPPPLTRMEASHERFVIRTPCHRPRPRRRRVGRGCRGVNHGRVRVAVPEGGEQRIGGAHSRTRVLPSFVPIEVDLCRYAGTGQTTEIVSSAARPLLNDERERERVGCLTRSPNARYTPLSISSYPGVHALRKNCVSGGYSSIKRTRSATARSCARGVVVAHRGNQPWTRGGGKRASVELGKDAKEDFEGRLCRGEARVEEKRACTSSEVQGTCREMTARTLETSFSSSWTWLVSR